MKYTIILTEKSDGRIHVTIPALPDRAIEAGDRNEAISLARQVITETMSRSELVLLDVPQGPKTAPSSGEVPWEWFGKARDDATWDTLFDDIEQRREATRKAR